eukprot:GEMP01042873.1.p1 GENE.GEMP01042873.1~~GEMP01042873.1.p1  ORF type:complete len:550 (+),score=109.55 GEMP01042873.1:104-1753(+)
MVGVVRWAEEDSNAKEVRWHLHSSKLRFPLYGAIMLLLFFWITNASFLNEPKNKLMLRKSFTLPASTLPASTLFKWPAEWLKTYPAAVLEESAREAEHWKNKTLSAMKHAYGAYRRPGVFGSDTVNPMTGRPGKTWGYGAYTMVDSLSTLWLMGFHDEFNKAASWIDKNLHFDYTGNVSVFETIIRELGGLLSAYALSKNPIFKRKAHELGETLMPAFENVLPRPFIALGSGKTAPGWFRGILLAEAGTLQLEFRYLSEITGDPKFRLKGDAVMDYFLAHGGNDGLIPCGWRTPSAGSNGPLDTHVSLGSLGDSYYEYLLKMYIQGNKKEPKLIKAWQRSMMQMDERLIRRSGTDYAAVFEESAPGVIGDRMEHLSCFVGGMLVLGDAALEDRDEHGYMSLGKNITAACFEMYKTKSGLAADEFKWIDGGGEPGHLIAKPGSLGNVLRPETAESIFYLFYYTGDPRYRRMAGHIIDAFEKEARCPYGYCSIRNVLESPTTKQPDMESFFLAETLKYLYLTFVRSPKEVLDLDTFVFNTEAHPLPRLQSE